MANRTDMAIRKPLPNKAPRPTNYKQWRCPSGKAMLGQDHTITRHQTCISNDSTIDSQEPEDSIFRMLLLLFLFFSLLSFLLLSIPILLTMVVVSKKMGGLDIFVISCCFHFAIQHCSAIGLCDFWLTGRQNTKWR
jgi:hypothetical protein